MRHTQNSAGTTKMKDLHLHKQFYLLLFSLVFITSYNAQDSISVQKDNTTEPNSNHPMIVKTQATGTQDNVFCGLQDKSGKLWFGTTGEGIYCYDGESFTNYTTKDGLNSNNIWCIIEDKAGNILFGTGRGICRYDGKSFVDITRNTDLNNYDRYSILEVTSISAMLEDKTGRLWVADYKNGVYLYDPSTEQAGEVTFTKFSSNASVKNDDGLKLIRTNCILEDRTGNIWFAGQNKEGLCRYDGKSLTQAKFKGKTGFDYSFRSILEDKKGKLLLGTQHHGLLSYVPVEDSKGKKLPPSGKASFINFTKNAGPGHSSIMSMIEDKNGNLWFSSDGEGVWRYDGKSFKNFNTKDGLLNNSVFSIVEDAAGNLWFGTRNVGLYRYDGKSFVNFSE